MKTGNTAVLCPTQAPNEAQAKGASVNLCSHHAQCELNYHLGVSLMPGLREGQTEWHFDVGQPAIQVHIELQEAAPYTTTVDVVQVAQESAPGMDTPRIRVRLYHDVAMAEVIAWDNHRHWLPVYTYPNRRMYLPDEKLAINRFLGEWLSHCLKLGIACSGVCESIRINKN